MRSQSPSSRFFLDFLDFKPRIRQQDVYSCRPQGLHSYLRVQGIGGSYRKPHDPPKPSGPSPPHQTTEPAMAPYLPLLYPPTFTAGRFPSFSGRVHAVHSHLPQERLPGELGVSEGGREEVFKEVFLSMSLEGKRRSGRRARAHRAVTR